MKLTIQPDDGIEPLLEALRHAKKSIQILIFRFDRSEIERELVDAVRRGVHVHALIAFTNRGEEKNLRKLESRFLEYGITVARTADDLVRYHGKMFIVDGKHLHLLAFNYTYLDIQLSRSFSLQISDEKLVAEAVKLFHADSARTPYKAEDDRLVVSPVNARPRLMEFIEGAKKSLLLYEMKVSDRDFVSLLNRKVAEGVEVRILSRAGGKGSLPTRILNFRLHARAILRDGESVFLGSQSLRKLEMEARREIGVIMQDEKVVSRMTEVFEHDWSASRPVPQSAFTSMVDLPAKKVARALAREVNLRPMVEQVLERVLDTHADVAFEPEEVSQTVTDAIRGEVHNAVVQAIRELVTEPAVASEAEPAVSHGGGHAHKHHGHEDKHGHHHHRGNKHRHHHHRLTARTGPAASRLAGSSHDVWA